MRFLKSFLLVVLTVLIFLVASNSYAGWKSSVTIVDFISARIDAMTEGIITITLPHHEIHEEDSYVLELVDTVLDNTEYFGVAFTTPAATTTRIHLIFGFISKAASHIELIEEPETLTNGTVITPLNRARFSSNNSALTNVKTYDSAGGDVITVGSGLVIHHLYTWTDKKHTTKNRDDDEFILDASTRYAVKFTADAAANAGQIIVTWYEHRDSN